MREEYSRDVHSMQKLLDNEFLLLAIHISISTLSYIVWGIIDLISIPTLGSFMPGSSLTWQNQALF